MPKRNGISVIGAFVMPFILLFGGMAIGYYTGLEENTQAPEPRTTEEVRAPEAPSLRHTLVMCELNTRRLLSEVESLQIPRWER